VSKITRKELSELAFATGKRVMKSIEHNKEILEVLQEQYKGRMSTAHIDRLAMAKYYMTKSTVIIGQTIIEEQKVAKKMEKKKVNTSQTFGSITSKNGKKYKVKENDKNKNLFADIRR